MENGILDINKMDLDGILAGLEAAVEEKGRYNEKYKAFIKNKRYIEILDSFIDKSINIDCLNAKWTEQMQMTFDFLYNNGYELTIRNIDSNDDVILVYKNNHFLLSELCGQGTYQAISTIHFIEEFDKNLIVNLDDLENFVLTGEKPMRFQAIKAIAIGLEFLEKLSGIISLDINYDTDKIIKYISENLK